LILIWRPWAWSRRPSSRSRSSSSLAFDAAPVAALCGPGPPSCICRAPCLAARQLARRARSPAAAFRVTPRGELGFLFICDCKDDSFFDETSSWPEVLEVGDPDDVSPWCRLDGIVSQLTGSMRARPWASQRICSIRESSSLTGGCDMIGWVRGAMRVSIRVSAGVRFDRRILRRSVSCIPVRSAFTEGGAEDSATVAAEAAAC